MNIARQHYQKALARQAAEAAEGALSSPSVAEGTARADGMGGVIRPDAATNEAALMLVKLTSDRARLKAIQSVERKVEAKREMLPEYRAWVTGLLEASDSLPEGQPNDVLTSCMMWLIDAGDVDAALRIAEPVLARKIPLPSWFDRQPACAIAENIAEAAFAAIRSEAGFDPDHIAAVQLLTEGDDMPDEVRAKLHKAAAMLSERSIDVLLESKVDDGPAGLLPALLDQAKVDAARALELHPGCGVKALIQKLDRITKKIAAERVSPGTA